MPARAFSRRRFLASTTCLLAPTLQAQGRAGQADNWPVQPIKWVIPFAPGGGADTIARLVVPSLSAELKANIIIENRPGASGIVGSDAVAKSAADGHTWLMSNNASSAIAPFLYPKPPYHPLNDFVHVAMIGGFANALLVRADHPAKSFAEFIRLCKQAPGKYTYASAGPGSAGHLTGELLKIEAGIDIVHVPYKGTGPAIIDLISGQIDALFDGLPASIGYVNGGKLRALAISSSERIAKLPNAPAIAETYPKVIGTAWFGISLPKGAPSDIVQRIASSVGRVLKIAELHKRLDDIGVVPSGIGSAAYAQFIVAERERWKAVIAASNIRID